MTSEAKDAYLDQMPPSPTIANAGTNFYDTAGAPQSMNVGGTNPFDARPDQKS